MERDFMHMIQRKWKEEKFLCVGLDIDYKKIPAKFLDKLSDDPRMNNPRVQRMKRFNEKIIDETKDLVCAYKPNSAFYEALGDPGFELLNHTIEYIKEVAPDVPIIDDAKRGDIGNTNNGYVVAIFGKDGYQADAVTVSPYLGSTAMKPFLDQKDKGIIVLCRTSNEGAGEFQDVETVFNGQSQPFYQVVAQKVRDIWNYNNNCLLVAGATYPEELAKIRAIVGTMPLLIPGIGTQGGDLEKTLEAGMDNEGDGIIINASSSIMYAENPRGATMKLHDEILTIRKRILHERFSRA